MDALAEAALAAREKAYCPYSGYQVGAALRTASGAVFTGANMENASYPEGWCAETSALAHMVMAGEGEIVEVAVATAPGGPGTPCGGCRQRLAEFGSADTIVRTLSPAGPKGRWTLGELLPEAFHLETGA